MSSESCLLFFRKSTHYHNFPDLAHNNSSTNSGHLVFYINKEIMIYKKIVLFALMQKIIMMWD